MTVAEMYRKYRIHGGLQMHQLRAASVAKYVCGRFKGPIDTRSVVLACLLHDMGNIIKSDLTSMPDLWEPEGTEYWGKVKAEFHERYGEDEHAATVEIARELGMSDIVVSLIDQIGFSQVGKAVQADSYEIKVCDYGDVRTGTHGVLSIRERLENWRTRYVERMQKRGVDLDAYYASLYRDFGDLETQLVQTASFVPEDINDTTTASIIEELRGYTI